MESEASVTEWPPDIGIEPYYHDDRVVIFNRDCRDVLPLLPKCDLMLADPPYEITATGGGIGAQREYLSEITGFTDCGFDESILAGFDNWMVFGTLRQVPKFISAADGKRWMLVTWNKPNPTPLCNGNYLPDTEYIVHCWSSGRLFGECEDKARFVVYPAQQNKVHPNEKPVVVMRKCIKNGSQAGDLILDPFAGSCTTAVAAKQLGRRCICIELSAEYCEIGKERCRQGVLW
jgi:DNA modification methylase